MIRRLFLTGSLLVLMTACVPATSTLLPTRMHITATANPTASVTPEASVPISSVPTASPTLAEPSLPPEPSPTATKTPLPLPTLELPVPQGATDIPQPAANSGAIQILSPGPLSKIVGPIKVQGYAVPGHNNNKGTLELYGEDGHLLASQLLQLNTPYKWAAFYWELSYNINSVGELGRLSLSTEDEYGRVNAVNSVHLLLLSEGQSIINPPDNLKERCVIELPVAGQRLAGGILTVAGKMRPYNNLPLTVELIARDGSVIGTQLVPISPATDDRYVPFRVAIKYGISQGTWALLVVRQFDDRIGGIMYLYSQEILLNP
jgi:hypothetical protein